MRPAAAESIEEGPATRRSRPVSVTRYAGSADPPGMDPPLGNGPVGVVALAGTELEAAQP
jgi:hypothetical protein